MTAARDLALDILSLNPFCREIGAGRLANLQELAARVLREERDAVKVAGHDMYGQLPNHVTYITGD